MGRGEQRPQLNEELGVWSRARLQGQLQIDLDETPVKLGVGPR